MSFVGVGEADVISPNRFDCAVDKLKYRNAGSERLPQIKWLQLALTRVHSRFGGILNGGSYSLADAFFRFAKVLRTGPLKTENRLLVVAYCKYSPDFASGRAFAIEEVINQCIDDVPLRLIGVLRFIDKDMIEPAIQLEAYPVSGLLLLEQFGCTRDQIIEI